MQVKVNQQQESNKKSQSITINENNRRRIAAEAVATMPALCARPATVKVAKNKLGHNSGSYKRSHKNRSIEEEATNIHTNL